MWIITLFGISTHPDSSPLPTGLVEQLRGQINPEDTSSVFTGDPYLGLSYFQEENTDRFFGRHDETLEALQKLGEDKQPESNTPQPRSHYYRWLQVHASSGAGKSSLVRAGLLPKIRQGALWRRTGYTDWLILEVMMPGEKPLEMLAQVLARAFPGKGMMGAWLSELNDPNRPEGLSYALRSLAKQGQSVLLVIDQFEELFTQSDTGQCRQFDQLLATALADPDCTFFLITAIRSDFLDRFEYLPELQRIYNSHKSDYLLPTITENGLRELITLPARLSGMQVGDDLTQAMVQDARHEPGALPLTESALSELWNYARHRGEQQLSKAYYEQNHGVVGMLAKQADTLINHLGDEGRKAALNLLLALTQVNEGGRHTRRRLSMDDAVNEAGGGHQGETIVRALAGKHDDPHRQSQSGQTLPLIVTGQEGDDGYVELVHEMLVRTREGAKNQDEPEAYWPTLHEYIGANRAKILLRQVAAIQSEFVELNLQVNAEKWNKTGFVGKYVGLANRRELREFSQLQPPGKNSLSGKYFRWSRWVVRGRSILLAGLLGLLLGESAWWLNQHPSFPLGYALLKPLWAAGLYQPLPKMSTIPSGKFEMGCKEDRDVAGKYYFSEEDMKACPENELPSHELTLNTSFNMGVNEVTFMEYDYYLWHQGKLDGTSVPDDENWGRFSRPVINVNWQDAVDYAEWLGRQYPKKQTCRLPTEAEWEYAARADPNNTNPAAYSWGDKVGKNKARCKDCDSQWIQQTAPVGQFYKNDFGLYDMSGNVQEWVQDCYSETYDGAPVDSFPREQKKDQCSEHVLRGGSWHDGSMDMRSASRTGETVGVSDRHYGFRVVCLP